MKEGRGKREECSEVVILDVEALDKDDAADDKEDDADEREDEGRKGEGAGAEEDNGERNAGHGQNRREEVPRGHVRLVAVRAARLAALALLKVALVAHQLGEACRNVHRHCGKKKGS